MAAVADPLEQQCPACGAAFRLADRRKRVQCPRCQEVVNIPATKSAPAAAPAGNGHKDATALQVRLEMLEARTAALEQEVAELRAALRQKMAAPKTSSPPSPPPPAPELHWHDPLEDGGQPPGDLPAAQQRTLLANLAALGSRHLIIQASLRDPLAGGLAEQFRATFIAAGWTTSEVQPAPPERCRHPLTLTSPGSSPPQEMAVLYMALAAAGLKLVSVIDPTLASGEPILSLGAQG